MSKAGSHSTMREHEEECREEGEMIIHLHVLPVCTMAWYNPACPGSPQTFISCTLDPDNPKRCLCRHRR